MSASQEVGAESETLRQAISCREGEKDESHHFLWEAYATGDASTKSRSEPQKAM